MGGNLPFRYSQVFFVVILYILPYDICTFVDTFQRILSDSNIFPLYQSPVLKGTQSEFIKNYTDVDKSASYRPIWHQKIVRSDFSVIIHVH